MNHPDYNSPAELKAFLEENGMAMQKKFGQNFLINETARKALIDALDIHEESVVWEVGPGLGSMTDEILKRGATLTAFEIDHGFARLLPQFFSAFLEKEHFTLVEGDVLKTWQSYAKTATRPDRFFGNLPYNVAATIIADMIENNMRFEKAVVTVQKEVGQRMCAKPATSDYSSFSVLCQWAYDVKPLMDLAGGNFWPRPNVDSRALVFTQKELFPRCQNPKLFVRLTRALFSSRRKTIRNNIQPLLNGCAEDAVFERAGISPGERAENLSVDEILALSDSLNISYTEKNK
ncbi:MAG: 16S rRNA (adenine(1518)-N(6)/adenine(1519)-N(6))-dimethyltransferase RsmA [Treponema sp.]|nr:16S rRNA (adenine(1518)-N(6)/adenine(1519)-N(6))-dimethyltransferase RsmA [Treponema sp.]